MSEFVSRKVSTSKATTWIDSEKILCTRAFQSNKLCLNELQDICFAQEKICENQSFPELVNLRDIRSIPSECQEFFLQPQRKALAYAFLVSSETKKILENFKLLFKTSSKPTKFFTCRKKARDWLHKKVSTQDHKSLNVSLS